MLTQHHLQRLFQKNTDAAHHTMGYAEQHASGINQNQNARGNAFNPLVFQTADQSTVEPNQETPPPASRWKNVSINPHFCRSPNPYAAHTGHNDTANSIPQTVNINYANPPQMLHYNSMDANGLPS